ncbi:hypothetical protein, partial [Bartonella sp. OT172YNZD]|uniref:hypothetical protein n=1 Tax=Bartonella sp. OT172YNZD TaxID=3243572 RepID=UPI0035CF448F
VLNRVVIRPILKKTPYEIWNGRKPNVKYFRAFGCTCFVLNNGKNNLGKFDAKADEAIFLGYSTSSKAFRVFNKRTLVIEESMHVTFDETHSITNDDDDIALEKLDINDKVKAKDDSTSIDPKKDFPTPEKL